MLHKFETRVRNQLRTKTPSSLTRIQDHQTGLSYMFLKPIHQNIPTKNKSQYKFRRKQRHINEVDK